MLSPYPRAWFVGSMLAVFTAGLLACGSAALPDVTGTGGQGTGGAVGAGASGSVGARRVPGTEGYSCDEPSAGALPSTRWNELAAGLAQPTLVTYAPGDARLFVVEHGGRIRIFDGDHLVEPPFLDIADKVASLSDSLPDYEHADRGLAGLTFHPDYAKNGLFYVHYQAMNGPSPQPTGTTVVAEYRVSSSDPNVADPGSENVLLTIPQPGKDHNGGSITFGSDGMLYLALGDGNSYPPGDAPQIADPEGNGQAAETPLAAILRIGVSPSPGGTYSIPAGNLAEAFPVAHPLVWDYGLRNPFRMNFDGCTGVLYIGDVGFRGREEINIELPGDGRRNYGWPIMEGAQCLESGCMEAGLTRPGFDYAWSDGASVIGGAVYRGSSIPELRGTYLYGDYGRSFVKTLVFDMSTGSVREGPELNSVQNVTSIQNGPDGEVYATSFSPIYPEGRLLRLEPQ